MIEIQKIIQLVLHAFRSRAVFICASTCDGFILRLHYRWTFFILLGLHFTAMYSWYYKGGEITCVSHFNAETQIRMDYLNVCQSYMYIIEDGKKSYLLFYRWIPYLLVLLAGLYYIPRKVSKSFDNNRCKSLLQDLASNESRYDVTVERALLDRTTNYMSFNIRTHDGLYWKFLTVNVVALLVDILALYFLDFTLRGRFISYGFKAFPFHRDPRYFTDYMSKTFPPFASCDLNEVHQLINKREETYGCHLTMMELYEKAFLILWLWLILLCFSTACYILFLLTMWLPMVDAFLLRAAKPVHANAHVKDVVHKVMQNCKIGDIYLLYRLRSHLSHVRFYELMTRLSHPDLCKRLHTKTEMAPNQQNITASKKPQLNLANNLMLNAPHGMLPIYHQEVSRD